MAIKDNILFSLAQSRRMLGGMMESMKSREDWLYQTHPKANHPLWVVAHLGMADNMFLAKLDPEAGVPKEGWDELFWFGSDIHGDSEKYPDTEEVVAYCHERREKLLAKIETLSDEFLNSPSPDEGMFSEAPNMAQLLLFVAYHEGVHSGQFSIAHRGLGHEPMYKPNPEAASSS